VIAFCAAVAGSVYVYLHINDEICRYVNQTIARHYNGLDVHVAGARLLENKGIEIRGLTITDPGSDEPLLTVDEIFLSCDTTLKELVSGLPSIEKIVIRRPTIRAKRDRTGKWDVARLLPLPKFSDSSPPTTIQDATVIIRSNFLEPDHQFVLRDGQITIKRQSLRSNEPNGQPQLEVRGTFGGRMVRHIKFQGTISPSSGDPSSGRLRLEGTFDDLMVSPDLLAAIPFTLPEHLAPLKTFHGKADVQFDITHDEAIDNSPQFFIAATIEQGQLEDPRLPHPLTDIQATVRGTHQFVSIDRLTARCGTTLLNISGQQHGLAPGSPLTLSASAEQIPLSRELFAGLPGSLSELWRKFQPTGNVSIEKASLTFDGQRWQWAGTVRCHEVAFAYGKFPYRVQRASGTLSQQGDHLSIDLVAHATDQPIAIRGEFDNPGPAAIGWVEVRGQNMQLDDKFIPAIRHNHEKVSRVIEQLQPAGRAHVFWRAWRDEPQQQKMHNLLRLDIVDGSVRYKHFPYPIFGIHGQIEAVDGQWTVHQLRGVNDTARITCNGTIRPAAVGGGQLRLTFTGTNVPLDEELYNALDEKTQKIWTDLRPRGQVNILEATVTTQLDQPEKPSVYIRLEPLSDTASIEPVFFPLRLEQLQGTVTYQDGHAQLADVRAVHGRMRISANGSCDCRPDGSWQVDFQDLSADRLRADRDLLQALPPALGRVIAELNPTGSFNLHGNLSLAGGPNPQTPATSAWDVSLVTHTTDVNCGIELSDVHGSVRLTGNYDGQRVRCRGELAVDSLSFLESQYTTVRGPFYIDNDRVSLGNRATRLLGEPPRTVSAQLFGGTFTADGQVILSDMPQYNVDTMLRGGQLQRFANETLPGTQQIKGNVFCKATFEGHGSTVDALQGKGQIQLRDADIYELPPIIALFAVLRASVPDNTAFTKSDMKFRIQGEHIYFERINLMGNAVSLSGKGEMNFDRQVNLTFHSLIGRNELNLPILKRILGQASEQIMRIHVTGDLMDPKITNELLPITNELLALVNETLKQLQVDAPASRTWTSLVPDPLGLLPRQTELEKNRR